MKFSNGMLLALTLSLVVCLVLLYVWDPKERFDTICSWKNPQSALLSLDIMPYNVEYNDTESAKQACAAVEECSGVLSMTAGSTTTYKLTRTQPTITNANENFRFIEKGMCRSGTEEPTIGNRGISTTNTIGGDAVVPAMSFATSAAAGVPASTTTAAPGAPRSGVVVIPAVGPPPMPATSTLGSTVGQSGMLGTNPPGPTN